MIPDLTHEVYNFEHAILIEPESRVFPHFARRVTVVRCSLIESPRRAVGIVFGRAGALGRGLSAPGLPSKHFHPSSKGPLSLLI